MPLGAAAAWGNVSAANWAQEGAWGSVQKAAAAGGGGGGAPGAGFWDDAIGATGKKQQHQQPAQTHNK